MATLAWTQLTNAGVDPGFAAAAAGGDKAHPGATSVLRVRNGGASTITVTIDSVTPSNYGTDVNIVGTVAAGAEKDFLLSPEGRFAGPDGLVSVTYSDVTSVTVANTYT